MPYIICVNQPGCLPEQDPSYAVATIEEAREAAADEIRRSWNVLVDDNPHYDGRAAQSCREALALPESGGTVGPLPDGYVIDVRYVPWGELSRLAGMPAEPQLQSETLDAYNQQEA